MMNEFFSARNHDGQFLPEYESKANADMNK